MSHPVRRRLTVAIVGVVAGALCVTGLGTLVLLRAQARQGTRRDVLQLASNVANAASVIALPTRLGAFQTMLRRTQDVAVVRLPLQAADRLPRGMTAADFDTARLAQGQQLSGFHGGVAYAAVPFHNLQGQALVAAATQPASHGGGAGAYLLLSSLAALFVAAAVAEALARRITRPLVVAGDATRRLAEGDLAVRIPPNPHASDELTSLAESINVMAANLERARGTERQFLMSVSHDLRTPLTSIRGFAEALADGTATDTARAADVIAAEARRLERLVRDLLELAKLDARRFSLDLRPTDVLEVVEDTTDGFVPMGERFGVRVSAREPVAVGPGGTIEAAPTSWPHVAADPDRLAQVIANLVENALKFAAGHVEVSVWFRLAPDGLGTAQITVDDDGPGISAEDLPHVFDRLWTATRDQGRQVGSGLGLTIVAELVAAMGGSIQAESPVPRLAASPIGTAGGATAAGGPTAAGGASGALSQDRPGTRLAVTLRTWARN